ncbi:MAG: type II secretion system F family protein [Lachnospirales bacterium]
MPYFYYKEAGKDGIVGEGYVDADNESDVIKGIKARGKTPVLIKPAKPPKELVRGNPQYNKADQSDSILNMEINIGGGVKLKDIAVFCKQMSVMLLAGMDLIRTIDVLNAQSENKKLKNALYDVGIELKKGYMLSRSLKRHPKVFPELLIAMVESGELTGSLDIVMENMSTHYTKEDAIQRKIKSAMVYPILLAVVATIVVVALLVFVLPTFVGMFDTAGMALPGPTQFLLDISDSIKNYYFIQIPVIIATVIGINMALKVPSVRYRYHYIISKIPMFGPGFVKLASARFCRTLATLLSSGIPIVRALEASAKVTNNQYIIGGMEKVIEEIKKGQALNILLRDMKYFPPMMISMVAIGEESGDIESMLQRTADYYDSEMEAIIKDLTSLVEPIMIVVMAVIIGFIVIALFLPMIESLGTVGSDVLYNSTFFDMATNVIYSNDVI